MSNIPKIAFLGVCFRNHSSATITISKIISGIKSNNLFEVNHRAGRLEHISLDSSENRNQNNGNITKQRHWLRRLISFLIGQKSYFTKISITGSLIGQIKKQEIDYIYCVPSNLAITEAALKLKESIPSLRIIMHVLDDKVKAPYNGLLGRLYRYKFTTGFRKLIEVSDLRLSISDQMSEKYQDRYDQKFHAFHNSIDTEKWQRQISTRHKANLSPKKHISILYAGAVGANFDAIYFFCQLLALLNKESDYDLSFTLHSNFNRNIYREEIDRFEFTDINGYVSQSELPNLLSSHDLLLLPLSLKERMGYTKISMPTKTTEYMFSRTPIILLAPEDAAVTRYANTYGWAYIISCRELQNAKAELLDFLGDKPKQRSIVENATKAIYNNHDFKVQQERFKEILLKNFYGTNV